MEKRRQEQNNLYWVWIGEIARVTHKNKDYIHEKMKERFLPEGIDSTTKLGVLQFAEYMNSVKEFAERRAKKVGIKLELLYETPFWKQ